MSNHQLTDAAFVLILIWVAVLGPYILRWTINHLPRKRDYHG